MLNERLFARHLEDDEIVREVVHAHWLIGLKFLFWPTLFFALPWVFFLTTPKLVILEVVALLSIASAIWWVRNFFDYFLDAWLLTNQGIIDVAWHGWFHRESSRILYSDIQGVSYEINGVGGTFLRYGTIAVEKISTGTTIALAHVPHPRRVEAAILRYMEEYVHSKNLKNAKHVQELLAEVVAKEIHLQELRKSAVKR